MKRITVAVLALLLVIGAVACDDQGSPPDATTPIAADTTAPTPEGLVIADGGVSEFKVIYPEGCGLEIAVAARDIANAIKNNAGARSVAYKSDLTVKPDDNNLEILIGETNRPQSIAVYQELAEDRMVMRVIGNKIVIAGGTKETTKLIAEKFIEEYIKGEKVEVPKDMDRTFEGGKKIEYKEIHNPIDSVANDPWVVRHGDDMYYCWSRATGGVFVKKISNLDDITQSGGINVWAPSGDTARFKEIWAPELHYIDGEWYIYFTAVDGDERVSNASLHKMYVLKGTSQYPTDNFTFEGKLTDSTDMWAIDGSVFKYKNELYYIWSGWKYKNVNSQHIYIAHMKDPMTIDSERVLLSSPEYPWEKVALQVNEGPVALVGDDTVVIVYSASACWTDNYCLGQLTFHGDDPLDASAWTKSPFPIFTKADRGYGPGHCSFVEAYDGKLWMVYHADLISGAGESGRTCRAQPVEWDGKTLNLGRPVSPDEPLMMPTITFEIGNEIK